MTRMLSDFERDVSSAIYMLIKAQFGHRYHVAPLSAVTYTDAIDIMCPSSGRWLLTVYVNDGAYYIHHALSPYYAPLGHSYDEPTAQEWLMNQIELIAAKATDGHDTART